MNTEQDFKNLWNKQKAIGMPETEVILNKAARMRMQFRLRLVIQTVALIGAAIVMLMAGLNIPHREWTTNVGLAMMILGILSYLATINRLLPMLFKGDTGKSSEEYLRQLILIKRMHEFLRRVMLNVYFMLLVAGLFVYLWQAALLMTKEKALLLYIIPTAALCTAYLFSKKKERKIVNSLNDTIHKLEAVNAQWRDS
jgi:hypothetical protein